MRPVALSNRLATVRSPVLGAFSWEKTKRPTITSHTVLDDELCVSRPKVVAGTEALRRRVASIGRTIVG